MPGRRFWGLIVLSVTLVFCDPGASRAWPAA
jgi:hypothetical protein